MRDSHKELAIKTAIQEYKNSVLFGFSSNTAHAINMMENVFIMCSGNIEGIEELRKTIKEASKSAWFPFKSWIHQPRCSRKS